MNKIIQLTSNNSFMKMIKKKIKIITSKIINFFQKGTMKMNNY